MAGSDFGDAVWRTSSHSHGDGNCVEVAAGPGRVGVRDSMDPTGPVLSFNATSWAAFLASVRRTSSD